MKTIILWILCIQLLSFPVWSEENSDLNRIIALTASGKIDSENILWLEKAKEAGGAVECLATALLYKVDDQKYLPSFQEYFRVDTTSPATPMSTEAVNTEVNTIIQENKGKHPLEITSKIYLKFKNSHKTYTKGELEVYLEKMFRAAVFTGVFNPSEEGLHKLSSNADAKYK